MSGVFGVGDLVRPASGTHTRSRPGIRDRRGLRVTLLSLAAAVLLLGAAVAAVSCYLSLGR